MQASDDAAEMSIEYYNSLPSRRLYVARAFGEETLEARLRSSAESAAVAATGRSLAKMLSGTAARAVYDTSRNTLIKNVREEGGKWERIPSHSACGFCRILGTRGPVYRSKTTALASHDWCGCEARLARPGYRVERPAYMDGWNDDYRRHVGAAAGLSGRDQINAIANSWNKELFATGVRSRTKTNGLLRDAA